MIVNNCPNCAAPLSTAPTEAAVSCDYCHTVVKPPDAPIVNAEIIEKSPPHVSDTESVKALRRELLEVKREHAGQVVRTLLAVFLILVPGVLVAIFGTLGFALAAAVYSATICLLGGIAVAGIGTVTTVYYGLGQTRCNERIRDIEQRLGIDNRTRAEKMVDGGMDWMFGRKN